MFAYRVIGSSLACGFAAALTAGSASAVVVFQDTTLNNGGTNIGATEIFAFGGFGFDDTAVAQSDGNKFAALISGGNSSGGGLSLHVDAAPLPPLADGSVFRFSLWAASDPNDPWQDLASDVLKLEFFAGPVGGSGVGTTKILDTEQDLGVFSSIQPGLQEGVWSQFVFEYTLDTSIVPPENLVELRPVLFLGDFTGNAPEETGTLFVDNLLVEVFDSQSEADATPLDTTPPGGIDRISPEDLIGDLNGDGFVGAGDLDILLGNWNNGIPPQAGGVNTPEPASLALLGLGGLVALRRRR